jgi:hypothetical protein
VATVVKPTLLLRVCMIRYCAIRVQLSGEDLQTRPHPEFLISEGGDLEAIYTLFDFENYVIKSCRKYNCNVTLFETAFADIKI